MSDSLQDSFGRQIRDLRISITDRCNFRCLYCLPENEEAANFYRERFQPDQAKPINYTWKPKDHFLTYEEIERLTRVLAGMGVQKIRITGGEPLLRRNVEGLIAKLDSIPGINDIALTTNGFLFPDKAKALHEAGLRRITFSLDSLDHDNFAKITGKDGLDLVLRSVEVAQEIGFEPIKLNAVVIRHLNDHEIEPLARFAAERGVSMRYIEFMPLDSSRAWQRDHVVPKSEILERLQSAFELEAIESSNPAETAKRWRIAGTAGEIGIIAPVTEPFCGHCNRIRLTADGNIRTCLFSLHEHDVKTPLRESDSDQPLAERLREIVFQKEAKHHIGDDRFEQPQRTMSYIGG
ncbi:MAG: GTP 3',8-cyclase MoaA [Limisphaerales bacterium]